MLSSLAFIHHMIRKNVLKQYLHDVFEKECSFEIGEEEVTFIQTGIETLVGNFVRRVLQRFYQDEDNNFLDFSSYHQKLKISKIIISRCSEDDLLKVGSFHEHTRNKFPDEFDFIFPVYCFEPTMGLSPDDSRAISAFLAPAYAISAKEILKGQNENFVYAPDNTAMVSFDKTVGVAGPATKLQFTYSKKSGQTRNISVDLVPAAIIKGEFADRCELVPFRNALKETGRVHMVKEVITFTETETRFMRERLSKNHRKVYRILKYLINGHDDTTYKFEVNTLREYSSYILKNFIIDHHYKCVRSDTLGHCVLDVLDEMCSHKTTDKMPMLSKHNARNKRLKTRKFFLLPYLEDLKTNLELMLGNTKEYAYENIKIPMSVSAQYKKDKKRGGLPLEMPDDFEDAAVNDDDVLTNYEE